MEPGHPASRGLLDSLKVFGESLLGMVHDRVELFSVELHEEKYRLIQIFIWISATVFTGMLALTFISITLVYLFWETARVAVLCSLTGAYVIAFVAILLTFKRFLASQPKPFAATLREFRKDDECIRPES